MGKGLSRGGKDQSILIRHLERRYRCLCADCFGCEEPGTVEVEIGALMGQMVQHRQAAGGHSTAAEPSLSKKPHKIGRAHV